MPYTIEAAQDGCYPGTTVLVNKFDLHTQKELNAVGIGSGYGQNDTMVREPPMCSI